MIHYPSDPHQMEVSCRADILSEEPLVGIVDEMVCRLDLDSLYARYSEGGRGFYDPAMLLRVLFFGYCDGVRSCRELAKHIRYDLRYRYFCGTLRPDFRTINRFRKDNVDLLGDYFAQVVVLCQRLGVLDLSVLALDGTKLRASASGRGRRRLAGHFSDQLHSDIARDGDSVPAADDPDGSESARGADPDARYMKTSGGGKRLSYNSHIVVDRNQLIVAAMVSTNADDSVSFQSIVARCETTLGQTIDRLVADGGYYSGANLGYAEGRGIDLYLPVSEAGHVPDAGFHRDAFVHDPVTDRYRCPGGAWLRYRGSRVRRGAHRRMYVGCAATCGRCRYRSRCTRGRFRTLEISEYSAVEQRMKAKLAGPTGRMIHGLRKHLVEPVFGNIKCNLGFVRYSLRRLARVQGEFFLICIAHNLKKLIARLGHVPPVHTAVRTITVCVSPFASSSSGIRRMFAMISS